MVAGGVGDRAGEAGAAAGQLVELGLPAGERLGIVLVDVGHRPPRLRELGGQGREALGVGGQAAAWASACSASARARGAAYRHVTAARRRPNYAAAARASARTRGQPRWPLIA
jgi:hypothetical protein